mmetsp:Transcript_109318/g.290419  ORF Transcript_109318/g.290419 Transcript_109318/m.290419 type:complete len:229 (+) Transcript_109318:277-963(+)
MDSGQGAAPSPPSSMQMAHHRRMLPCATTTTHSPSRAAARSERRPRPTTASALSPPGNERSNSPCAQARMTSDFLLLTSAARFPCSSPKWISRRPASRRRSAPGHAAATMSAVSLARARSEEITASTFPEMPSFCRALATLRACPRPTSLSSMSSWPCVRFSAFQTVSPWRTRSRRVVPSFGAAPSVASSSARQLGAAEPCTAQSPCSWPVGASPQALLATPSASASA